MTVVIDKAKGRGYVPQTITGVRGVKRMVETASAASSRT